MLGVTLQDQRKLKAETFGQRAVDMFRLSPNKHDKFADDEKTVFIGLSLQDR